MTVSLFFMHRSPGGGATSFTVHLYESMRRAGLDPYIYRVAARTESRRRMLGKYEGVEYHNVSPEDALEIVDHSPSLMTAACHSRELAFERDIIRMLIKSGMRVVVHDPNEFKIYDHLNMVRLSKRPICIRPTMRKFFPDAHFIPHPYVRRYPNNGGELVFKDFWATSVARVTFVKRTELILAANRLLPPDRQIVLRGAENRLYTRFKLRDQFPEFVQGSTGFPLRWHASAEECARARMAVDLTYFPDDGGGSQYSFMEAWDAGTANVIHEDWLRYPGEMSEGVRCWKVDGARTLAHVVATATEEDLAPVVEAGYDALRAHDPVDVARAYYEELIR